MSSRRTCSLVIVCLVGCTGRGDDVIEAAAAQAQSGAQEPTFPFVPELRFPPHGVTPGSMEARRVYPDLQLDAPIQMSYVRDGSRRVFVLELKGKVRVFRDEPDVREAKTFLELPLEGKLESGMRSFTFDPDFAENGLFYLAYTVDKPIRSVISRFAVDPGDPDRALPDSEEILLSVPEPNEIHNVGSIEFGPDGMLYIAMGDGGGAGDPQDNGQNLATLHGKVLRIDVRGSSPGQPYRIPPDNPFVGTEGARPEIWAYGLRNPWRMSIDPRTGEIWLGDVGQDNEEEVDLITRGANYGWAGFEGTAPFKGGIDFAATTAPVYRYPHTQGSCVVGGVVYHGTTVPQVRGRFVFTDLTSGRVYALQRPSGGKGARVDVLCRLAAPGSVVESPSGQLLVVSLEGPIHELVPREGEQSEFPVRLSATGLFADTARLQANPRLLPYELVEPSWQDGARKRHWIALPEGGRIGFDPTGDWRVPRGTVLVQHLEMPMVFGDPSTVRRIETRVLVFEVVGVGAYVYRWNDAGTDADLVADAEDLTFDVFDPAADGGRRAQAWRTPGTFKCFQCHLHKETIVLGLNTRQLNRAVDYGGGAVEQLDVWSRLGMFSGQVPPAATLHRSVSSKDPREPLDRRARSYLAANCACCHRPCETMGSPMDLREQTPLADAHLLGVPFRDIAGMQLVTPGEHRSSQLHHFMTLRGAEDMPPLGSTIVDGRALRLIAAWIDGMK